MPRSIAIALVAGMLAAAPAAAQWNDTSRPDNWMSLPVGALQEPVAPNSRGIEFPLSQYVDHSGTTRQRRGIVVGTEIAPDTTVGVGLFDILPRSRSLTPPADVMARPKRARSAAVGITLRF